MISITGTYANAVFDPPFWQLVNLPAELAMGDDFAALDVAVARRPANPGLQVNASRTCETGLTNLGFQVNFLALPRVRERLFQHDPGPDQALSTRTSIPARASVIQQRPLT